MNCELYKMLFSLWNLISFSTTSLRTVTVLATYFVRYFVVTGGVRTIIHLQTGLGASGNLLRSYNPKFIKHPVIHTLKFAHRKHWSQIQSIDLSTCKRPHSWIHTLVHPGSWKPYCCSLSIHDDVFLHELAILLRNTMSSHLGTCWDRTIPNKPSSYAHTQTGNTTGHRLNQTVSSLTLRHQ